MPTPSTPQAGHARQPARVGPELPADEYAGESLWERYWRTRDRGARNDLVIANNALVKLVVSRLPANIRSHWETDDLRSFGFFGLIEAIDRWAVGSPANLFARYATKRIRGSIFDEIRRLDWLPRTARRRVIAYRSTVDDLSSELRRTPETREVLAEMGADGATADDVRVAVQSSQLLYLQHSAGAQGAGEDLHLIDLIAADGEHGPESHVLRREQLEEVRHAITRLPERQRTVVTLRFLEGLTQEQIGAMLGVGNSRVCQIQATAMQTLRRLLASGEERRMPGIARPA